MNNHGSRMRAVLGMTLGFWLMVIPAANAYLDPGTGSVIFQAVIAGAMVAGLGAKVFWRRLKSILTGRSRAEMASEEHDRAD